MKTHTSILLSSFLSAGLVVGVFQFIKNEETKIIVKEVASEEASDLIHATNYSFPTYMNSGSDLDFTVAAENSLNAVVHIKTSILTNVSVDPIYRLFYGDAQLKQEASGSGVIISQDGYIATNNHVVRNAQDITVTLNNNETYTAELIGTDPSTDLALLKISKSNLPYLDFADSDNVKVGEWALAVGNPFNLTSTVTAGIVSAKARNIHILKSDYQNEVFPIESFIQTDAAVNPGNSGGALVNTKGELIGINTAIASKTGSYSGYSFAIPSNIVRKITSDLANYGVVQRGFIGVSLMEITPEMLEKFELNNLNGVLVTKVMIDGAGYKAGLKSGDIILKVEGNEVNKVPSLQEQISKYSPGDQIGLTIKRNGTIKNIEVTLRNKNGETDVLTKDI